VVKNVAGVFSLVIDEDTTPSDTIVAGSTTWNDVAGNVTIAPNNQVTFGASVNGAPATTSDTAVVRDDGATILAVGGARRVCVEAEDGIAFATRIAFSLSCDHRAIDGATGAKFLAALKTLIEEPKRLFG